MEEGHAVNVDIIEILFIVVLVVLSVYDLKYMEVPLILIGLELLLGFISIFIGNKEYKKDDLLYFVLVVLILGIVFFLIGLKAIGMGDFFILLAIAMLYKPHISLRIFAVTYLCLMLFSIIYVIIRKNLRNGYLPFMPFVLAAEVILKFI